MSIAVVSVAVVRGGAEADLALRTRRDRAVVLALLQHLLTVRDRVRRRLARQACPLALVTRRSEIDRLVLFAFRFRLDVGSLVCVRRGEPRRPGA